MLSSSLVTTFSILSLISSIIIIASYFRFPSLRTKSALLLIWLSIATVGFNFMMLFTLHIMAARSGTENENSMALSLSGFFSIFFCLATCFWSAAITETISIVAVKRNVLLSYISNQTKDSKTKNLARMRMIRYHVYIWVTAGVCAMFPSIFGCFVSYPFDWYWFASDMRCQLIAGICYYMPLVLVTTANVYIWYQLSTSHSESDLNSTLMTVGDSLSSQLNELVQSLKWFSLVSIVVSVLVIVVEIVRLSEGGFRPDTQWLFLLTACTQQSQGTFHLIVYAFRPAVRSAWFSVFVSGDSTDEDGLCEKSNHLNSTWDSESVCSSYVDSIYGFRKDRSSRVTSNDFISVYIPSGQLDESFESPRDVSSLNSINTTLSSFENSLPSLQDVSDIRAESDDGSHSTEVRSSLASTDPSSPLRLMRPSGQSTFT